MGQIKNIKLHIVTDIKLSIIQSIIKMAVREEREGIIYDNPEKFYDIEASEIGYGKMSKVAIAKSKTDGKQYAAKMIYFDDDTRFAVREFCAPEMLNFDPVLPASDMWSVAIIMYIMLSGISPFFYEDEAKVLQSVQYVKYQFCDAFDEIS